MKPAATLTAFAAGLAAVFGAAYAVGGAVPALTDPAPAAVTPHDTTPTDTTQTGTTGTDPTSGTTPDGRNQPGHPTGNAPGH